jgi:hypothetical protein
MGYDLIAVCSGILGTTTVTVTIVKIEFKDFSGVILVLSKWLRYFRHEHHDKETGFSASADPPKLIPRSVTQDNKGASQARLEVMMALTKTLPLFSAGEPQILIRFALSRDACLISARNRPRLVLLTRSCGGQLRCVLRLCASAS